MMNKFKTFADFRSEISIIEIATANGYRIDQKAGLKWPVLKNDVSGDKIIIANAKNSANQGYWNAHDENDRGTLISFVQNRLGSIFDYDSLKSDMSNVNAVLYNFLNLPLPERRELKKSAEKIADREITDFFEIPNNIRDLNNPGYLIGRKISKDTVHKFKPKMRNVETKTATGVFDNIAFPYFDKEEQVVDLEIRNKQFKKMESGSNRSIGVWHSPLPENRQIANTILTESPIDALSYYELKGKNYPLENTLYVAFGGTVANGQMKTVLGILSNNGSNKNCRFITAVDNDEMGRAYNEKFKKNFQNVVEDFPSKKDYNDELKALSLRNNSKLKLSFSR